MTSQETRRPVTGSAEERGTHHNQLEKVLAFLLFSILDRKEEAHDIYSIRKTRKEENTSMKSDALVRTKIRRRTRVQYLLAPCMYAARDRQI